MRRILHIALLSIPALSLAQNEFIINNGTDIRINPGCQVIFAEGGVMNASGTLSNAGELTVEGNLVNSGTLVGGTNSGLYRILNDVENNGTMQPGQCEFELYGDNQFLRGLQQHYYYDLTLTGGGIKYMLRDIETIGTLRLNDRELHAGHNTVYHENTGPQTITATYNEGFVSALSGGGLSRRTDSGQEYIFPVGSSDGTFRYRPISLLPTGGSNRYKVRHANEETPFALQRGAELYYVNIKYYHVVERLEGTAPADLTVYYDAFEDGFFQTLAHLDGGSTLWRENTGTIQGPTLGSAPELTSFTTNGWDGFIDPEISLAALSTELFVPNVFSPNEDGQNEVFRARGTDLYEFEMRIYDRWGNKVFESHDIEKGWDGTYRGQLMNSGVFVYYILSGGELVAKGNVTLLR